MAGDRSVGGVGTSSVGAAPILEELSVPDFDPSAQTGYMTSGEIMAWLATVGGNTYDQMRQQMVGTEQRRELQKDLTSLKALVEEAEVTKDPDKVEAAMKEIIAKYEGTPLEARVKEALGTRLTAFEGINEAKAEADTEADPHATMRHGLLGQATIPLVAGGPTPELRILLEKEALIEQLDSWSTEIQGLVDDLGKEDQLALIKIQELNSQITQSTQLASNILAAQDQAASTAIMNMKV